MPTASKPNVRNPKIRRMAIIGPSGSHSHESFLKEFSEAKYKKVFVTRNDPRTPFQELIESIKENKAICAFVPFYNTRAAYFHVVPGHIIRNPVHIVDFRPVRIRQHLMTTKEVKSTAELSGVLTNQQCYEQSKDWLLKHLPHIKTDDKFPSSSAAAREVMKRNRRRKSEKFAVVGAELLTKLPSLKLKMLRRNIEAEGKKGVKLYDNITTFLVISHRRRALKDNPYGVYVFSAGPEGKVGEVDKRRGVIATTVAAHKFKVSSQWAIMKCVRGKKVSVTKFLSYVIETGTDPDKVKAFEQEMKRRYGRGFLSIGRVNKPLKIRHESHRVK